MMDEVDMVLKGIFVGSSQSGKSNLISVIGNSGFIEAFMPTIGIDFRIISYPIGGVKAKVQLWDAAGLDRFRSITVSQMRHKQFVIAVYDCTSRDSFKQMKSRLELAKEMNRYDFFTMAIVANKVDLGAARVVTEEEGTEYAKLQGCMYFETSAKVGTGIKQMMDSILKDVVLYSAYKHKSLSLDKLASIQPAEDESLKQLDVDLEGYLIV